MVYTVGNGFDFFTAVATSKPGQGVALMMYMIFASMVLLNGLISIFGHSFDSQVEVEASDAAEKEYIESKKRDRAMLRESTRSTTTLSAVQNAKVPTAGEDLQVIFVPDKDGEANVEFLDPIEEVVAAASLLQKNMNRMKVDLDSLLASLDNFQSGAGGSKVSIRQ